MTRFANEKGTPFFRDMARHAWQHFVRAPHWLGVAASIGPVRVHRHAALEAAIRGTLASRGSAVSRKREGTQGIDVTFPPNFIRPPVVAVMAARRSSATGGGAE